MSIKNQFSLLRTIALLCSWFIKISNAIQTQSDVFIESPQVTNWGEWGELELCPSGTYAAGMQLKVEPYMVSDDDTAINGIRLFCIAPGTNDFDEARSIISAHGDWGNWGKEYLCDKGAITGFQLLSEPDQGPSGDNTGAANLRVFCSNLQGGFLEGNGHPWGDWTEPQRCLSQQAVCGIKTQVQSYVGGGDDTALNNLAMKCCEVPNMGERCSPSDNWETVLECDNTKGTEPLSCSYQKSRGISKSTSASEALIQEYNMMVSLGFSASVMYNGLSANFRSNLSISESTGYSWGTESSETWNEATTVSTAFDIPGGMRSRLSQAVGNCGFFQVFSNYFRKEDFTTGGQSCGINYFHN